MTVYTLKNLHKWAESVQMKTEQAVRHAALDLAGKIISATPVDTGAARANWNITADSPDLSADKPPNKNRRLRPSEVPKVKLDQKIIISNNLPYIQRLEHGSSKQSPAGMVSVSIATWDKALENAARDAAE